MCGATTSPFHYADELPARAVDLIAVNRVALRAGKLLIDIESHEDRILEYTPVAQYRCAERYGMYLARGCNAQYSSQRLWIEDGHYEEKRN
jgi:hypothetical protein